MEGQLVVSVSREVDSRPTALGDEVKTVLPITGEQEIPATRPMRSERTTSAQDHFDELRVMPRVNLCAGQNIKDRARSSIRCDGDGVCQRGGIENGWRRRCSWLEGLGFSLPAVRLWLLARLMPAPSLGETRGGAPELTGTIAGLVFIKMLGGGTTRGPHRTCLALVAVRQYRLCFAWFYSRRNQDLQPSWLRFRKTIR